jgi:hypothetical protein
VIVLYMNMSALGSQRFFTKRLSVCAVVRSGVFYVLAVLLYLLAFFFLGAVQPVWHSVSGAVSGSSQLYGTGVLVSFYLGGCLLCFGWVFPLI